MCSASIDSNGIIHIVSIDRGDSDIDYITFDTSDDTYGTPENIKSTLLAPGFDCAVAIDSNNKPHVVFTEPTG